MGRIAYLFPGQGCQEVGMGLGFAEFHAESREVFAQADAALDFGLSELIRSGPKDTLSLTAHTQPAVLAASLAALAAGRAAGLPPPAFVAGHSLGEWTALVAAGALAFEDAVRTVRARGQFMQEAVPLGEGAMAAVLMLSPDEVQAACAEARAERVGEWVGPANFNGPDQTVIAGHAGAVALASERCRSRGARRVLPLGVSAPFHCPLMEPVKARLAVELARIRVSDPSVPLVTNVEAAPEQGARVLASLLVEQVTAPVRWTEIVSRLVSEGVDTFLEFGPGQTLSGLVRRQVPEAKTYSISSPEKLEAALAALAA